MMSVTAPGNVSVSQHFKSFIISVAVTEKPCPTSQKFVVLFRKPNTLVWSLSFRNFGQKM